MIKKTTSHSLKLRFDREVKQLQKTCLHKKTKWYDHHWAIGHGSGYQIKACLRCNKSLAEKPTYEERIRDMNPNMSEKHIQMLLERKK